MYLESMYAGRKKLPVNGLRLFPTIESFLNAKYQEYLTSLSQPAIYRPSYVSTFEDVLGRMHVYFLPTSVNSAPRKISVPELRGVAMGIGLIPMPEKKTRQKKAAKTP